MIGQKGVLGATDSVAFLLGHVEQAKGVAGRLEGIGVGSVLYLSSKVLVAASNDSGEHLVKASGVASLIRHHLLAFGLTLVLGALRIIGCVLVAWIGLTIKDLRLNIPNGLTRVVAVLEGRISRQPLVGLLKCGWYEGTECCAHQILQ